jgi:hypothetical protein
VRIRVALTLGAFLIAGGAFTGTAMAGAAEAPAQPSATTAPPAEPTLATSPTPGQLPSRPEAVPATSTPPVTRLPASVAPSAIPQRVPRAIPAGPTGDLHLPAITASN